ncbi:pyridoxamine 5'-phosphate oxidase [Salinisphaera orenii MK-B5]|uniref:Pyridoxamine 5'-phosphate oxidase n=1 Tax=Salinisphaera orenii MK-B5 TaxID=856730 RepID=A0A423PNR7_9GAMM|nr:pyridoxal 5'-phosphate synthase [Salinisphaera orenii]ROO27266.1 pyridoxamine 5'-phosphate oxidase [Salinisphaera orenii MK-B5]
MNAADMSDPVGRVIEWIAAARERGERDAQAATLATVDPASARPSVRTVYVQTDADTLVFFVNANTGKGQHLRWHPHAALCFFWRELQQQINIEGVAEVLDNADADRLWAQRQRDSQLSARSSAQEAIFGDIEAFRQRREREHDAYSFEQVPRPEHWIGYRLLPTRIEFWAAGWHRLRPRELFERDPDGGWQEADQEP